MICIYFALLYFPILLYVCTLHNVQKQTNKKNHMHVAFFIRDSKSELLLRPLGKNRPCNLQVSLFSCECDDIILDALLLHLLQLFRCCLCGVDRLSLGHGCISYSWEEEKNKTESHSYLQHHCACLPFLYLKSVLEDNFHAIPQTNIINLRIILKLLLYCPLL